MSLNGITGGGGPGAAQGLTGGGGPLSAAQGLTGGGGPLSAAQGLTGGGGGPLNAVTGAAGGDGNPLNSVTSLAGGITGGEGSPLDAVSGLGSGLLGGSQGLNVLGLAAIGSDDEAAIDLAPAEKKKEKARKAAIKKQNDDKRQKAFQELQQQVKAQNAPPTPAQQALARQLNESQAADDAQMAKYERTLGPTDPELYQQAMNGQLEPSTNSGPSQGLYYAYLVDAQSYQPTHLLTFPNAATANQWFQTASKTSALEKTSDQMFTYSGPAPRPSGRMGYMPISTVQPIIPLQRGDGYPICCKSGSGGASSGTPSTSSTTASSASQPYQAPVAQPVQNAYVPPPAPVKPPRQKLTFEDAANAHARDAIARGDTRPRDEIVREALQDLKDNCAHLDGAGQPAYGCTNSSGPAQPAYTNTSSYAPAQPAYSNTNGYASAQPVYGSTNGAAPAQPGSASQNDPAANNPLGSLGNSLPAGLGSTLGGATSGLPLGGAGGDLLGGLLGGSQGLNVLGLAAIGSDEDAAIDLAPGEKKASKLRKQQELEKQKQIQDQQLQALQNEIARNGGRQTALQQQQLQELRARNQALKEAQRKVDEGIARDEAAERAQGGGVPAAGPAPVPALPAANTLPTQAVPTQALPTNNLPANPLGSL